MRKQVLKSTKVNKDTNIEKREEMETLMMLM